MSNQKYYRGYYFRLRLIQPAFNDYLQRHLTKDNTLTEQIESPEMSKTNLSLLHPAILEKCYQLFSQGHHAEAVEKSFKVVKDRLRELTGYESGSDAFGKTKLHIKGAAAANVDSDFNTGTKFLTMAIDMYRNEKSHTSDAKIDDPVRAHQYLVLSSLALALLDNSEMIK